MGKLCSKLREDWSTNNVTFLSTVAGRTDGRLRDFIFCPMHMHSIGQIKNLQTVDKLLLQWMPYIKFYIINTEQYCA